MCLAAHLANGRFTFGPERAEILSAQANGVTVPALSTLLAVELIRRLIGPPESAGGLMLATALVGGAANIWTTSRRRIRPRWRSCPPSLA